MQDIC
jgi:hypothetical protein